VGVKDKVFFHVQGMKANRETEVWFHLFLISALDGSGSHSGCVYEKIANGALRDLRNTPALRRHSLKCTLVHALRLCTGRTAQRGSRGLALLFLDQGTRRGRGVSVTPRPLFTSGKDSVPIVQEDGWAPGPVWTGAENLAPTGIRFSDRPSRSQLLYRLRCPAYEGILCVTKVIRFHCTRVTIIL
jgi:hypothetical protein